MAESLVLVTEPEFRRAEAVFTAVRGLTCAAAPAGEADLAAQVSRLRARHVIVGPSAYRGALYGAMNRGSVLARFGVGWDGIDLARATSAGLLCTNTPDVLTQSVAEHAMLLVAAAARRLPALDRQTHDGEWTPEPGVELLGKTLAIIGLGRIGRALARIAAGGFQMRVVACRRGGPPPGGIAADDGIAEVTTDFRAAVQDADYVSLHIPATPENAHFINRERLGTLREHAWLINTARGAVVDEVALYEALAERRIGGAALDVFEREPYEPAASMHDLRRLPNVILAPHVGSNTADANRRMAARALRNILAAESGAFDGLDLLNPEVLRRPPAT